MNPLQVVKLTSLMDRTSGRGEVRVGLIDGPIAMEHPDLVSTSIHELTGKTNPACSHPTSVACLHGTFVAGILSGKRGSVAPAICPDCTLLARSIFGETETTHGEMPSATPEELAIAILDCIDAGAHVLNISVALAQPSLRSERA